MSPFCRTDSHAVQYPKSFLVLDNSDIDAMLGIIYEERGLTLRDMTYSAARDMIEIRKLFKEPEYYKDMITMSLDTLREKYERADTAGTSSSTAISIRRKSASASTTTTSSSSRSIFSSSTRTSGSSGSSGSNTS